MTRTLPQLRSTEQQRRLELLLVVAALEGAAPQSNARGRGRLQMLRRWLTEHVQRVVGAHHFQRGVKGMLRVCGVVRAHHPSDGFWLGRQDRRALFHDEDIDCADARVHAEGSAERAPRVAQWRLATTQPATTQLPHGAYS